MTKSVYVCYKLMYITMTPNRRRWRLRTVNYTVEKLTTIQHSANGVLLSDLWEDGEDSHRVDSRYEAGKQQYLNRG